MGDVLGEFGVEHDHVVEAIEGHAPRIIETVQRDGHLATVIRQRLEPFFASDEVLAILTDAE